MAIRVQGTLVISRKKGKRGDFNVGDLCTEIGEFEVKDSLIEEFDEGRYRGDFIIKWIEPDSFAWRGKVFVKNRATLEEIIVDHVDDEGTQPTEQPPTIDPVDAAAVPTHAQAAAVQVPAVQPPATASAESPPRRSRSGPSVPPAGVPSSEELFGAALFSELQSKQPIKLDPTVDRVQFRLQRDRLKEMGYGFDAKIQTWSLSHEESVLA
jgi:hypothetical protein